MKALSAVVFVLAVCLFAANGALLSAQTAQTAQTDSQPSITNGPVAEYVSDSAATLGWSSTMPGKMTVRYGIDRTKLTQTAAETGERRNHHARLDGLKPNTRYYFQVYAGSEPVGGIGTFSTVEKGEAPERSKVTIPE